MSSRNLRRKPRISYYEIEEPNLDEYVFCDQCGDYVFEYCSIHGPLLVVPDDKVVVSPPSVSGHPSPVPRAALTIPHEFLHLARSRIPDAGVGVFATRTLPAGVRFGPYSGQRAPRPDPASQYCWQIYSGSSRRPLHVVDAQDPQRSNWMRYVNCSRHWREQNLVAFQYQGELYYRTVKIIPRFSELLVFYGAVFAHALSIDLKRYHCAPPPPPQRSLPPPPPPSLPPPTPTLKRSTSTKKTTLNNNEGAETQTAKKKRTTTHEEKRVSQHTKTSATETPATEDEPPDTSVEIRARPEASGEAGGTRCGDNDPAPVTARDDNKNTLLSKVHELSCDICDYTTNTVQVLNSHLRAHAAAKRFSCDLCSYITTRKDLLAIHLKAHTNNKPFVCKICGAKFKRSSHLKQHSSIHTAEKPYSCDVCHKNFNRKGDLDTHRRIHTGEKPYSCGVCHKSFNQKGDLTRHRRIHTGEKPYSCDVCHKSFNYKNVLDTHRRMHTGEKPYSCDVCHKSFNQKPHLDIHRRIHTGEKPYACDVCHKSFIDKSALGKHRRIHTGEKPYSCGVCHKSFNQKTYLNRHRRIHTV